MPEVEPIITDQEFDSSVPKVDWDSDPELDHPLESIEEFERRLAQEEADAEPTEGGSPPLGEPALADGDPIEEIGDAPIRDAELTKPLPPIEDCAPRGDIRPVCDMRTPEDIAARVKRCLEYAPAEKLVFAPDCGLSQTALWAAKRKLVNQVAGVNLVKKELGIS